MSTDEKSRIIPNTFNTPNITVDEHMRLIDGDELKCYLVVVRKTFGWWKRSDRIAKNQLVDLTGLSDGCVNRCMKSLVRFGMVIIVSKNNPRENHGIEWAIQTDDTKIDKDGLIERGNKKKAIDAERAAKARAKKNKVGMSDNPPSVPQPHPGVVPHTPQKPLSKTNKEEEAAPTFGTCYTFFDENFGVGRKYDHELLGDFVDEHTAHWTLEAMKIAVKRGARNLSFVEAVLNRWKTQGYGTPYPSKNGKNGLHPAPQPKTETPEQKAKRIQIAQELVS